MARTITQHVRFRPPESTRLWQSVDRVMTYLIVSLVFQLCPLASGRSLTKPSERPQFSSLLTLSLSLAVIIEILAPLVSWYAAPTRSLTLKVQC